MKEEEGRLVKTDMPKAGEGNARSIFCFKETLQATLTRLDLKSSTNVLRLDLEESIVDMIASRWERQFGGREDASAEQLADMEEKYLLR